MKTATKSNITYDKVHDIFDIIPTLINGEHLGHSVIIPNICNIKSKSFSNGYASQLASRFPSAHNAYDVLSDKERHIGNCQIIPVMSCKNKEYNHKIYVANMMCQIGFNSKTNRSRNINYAALAACFNKINHFLVNHLSKETDCEIRTHKYLINYVGADNRFVTYLLEDVLHNHNIVIHLN